MLNSVMRFTLASAVGIVVTASVGESQTAATGRYVSGRVLVKFKTTSPNDQAAAVAALRARFADHIQQIGVHILELPQGTNERAVVNALKARADVEFAELDSIISVASVVPNDPWYANWEPHLRQVYAPAAWAITTGSNVTVAIVDSGVDGTHEDLLGNMVAGWNFYDNNSDTHDVFGHGTQVAGTIAAASNNGIGVASVCWGCWIMPIRVTDTSGNANFSTIANALTWAADHGARIANMSMGVTDSSTVKSAAQYFQSKGGVSVAAAGNGGTFDSSPDNPYILTVSAVDSSDVLYSWSNTGNNVDLSAPGCVYTTRSGGGYTSACGTSFSAPIVAGVAALLYSLNPSLSPAQVVSTLEKSADDLGAAGWDPSYGWGRVNAANALTMASTISTTSAPPTVSFVTPANGSTVAGSVTVQVSATDSNPISSVTVYLDNAVVATSTAAPYTFSWNSATASNGNHTMSATAKDAAGNSATASISIGVNNIVDLTPPTAAITSPASGSIISNSIVVQVSAQDNVGVTSVDLLIDGVAKLTDTAAPFSFKYNSSKLAAGGHTLQARAHDAAGNTGLSPIITVYK